MKTAETESKAKIVNVNLVGVESWKWCRRVGRVTLWLPRCFPPLLGGGGGVAV